MLIFNGTVCCAPLEHYCLRRYDDDDVITLTRTNKNHGAVTCIITKGSNTVQLLFALPTSQKSVQYYLWQYCHFRRLTYLCVYILDKFSWV